MNRPSQEPPSQEDSETLQCLHIGKYYDPYSGGIERFLSELLPVLAGNNVAVTCLVHHHRKFRKTERELREGVRVVRVLNLGEIMFSPFSPTFRKVLLEELANRRFDCIHVHMPNPSAFWLLGIANRHNIAVILHWHSDTIVAMASTTVRFSHRFYQYFEKKLLKSSAKIIATSDAYKHSSQTLHPWLDKTVVVPLGLGDAQSEGSAPPEASIDTGDAFRVLVVGRLTYYKGHEYLIRAMRTLDSVLLTVVGEGRERRRLEALVGKYRLQDRVSFRGHCSDSELQALLINCGCLVLPSIERTEAFGVVLLEAMRAAKPVIVTNVDGSGMSWVVRHGATGLVVESKQAQALAEAIEYLRLNPNEARKMGVAGRQRFVQCFDIRQVAARIQDIYRSVL